MLNPAARPTDGKGYVRVLVLDPKAQSRSVLKGSLRSLDLIQSVLERSSPQDLLQILSESPVHVVMIEHELEGADPLQVVREVSQHPNAGKPSFILVSQQIEASVRAQAVAAGVKGFLTKPFDLVTLERTIRDSLSLNAAPEPAHAAAHPAAAHAAAAHPAGTHGHAPGAPAHAAHEPSVNRDILDRLRRIHLFSGFTDAELIRLLRICQMRQFVANQYVFREGEPGGKMYVLVSGQVDMRQTRDGAEKVLVTMKPGDCFGEMAILDAGPRSADAFCLTPCMVIEVKAETVNRDDDPIALKLVRQIAILLAQKLRRMSH